MDPVHCCRRPSFGRICGVDEERKTLIHPFLLGRHRSPSFAPHTELLHSVNTWGGGTSDLLARPAVATGSKLAEAPPCGGTLLIPPLKQIAFVRR